MYNTNKGFLDQSEPLELEETEPPVLISELDKTIIPLETNNNESSILRSDKSPTIKVILTDIML